MNYSKTEKLNGAQELTDMVCELKIDQAKYFNFMIDDIDRVQSTPRLMELAMQNAANALVNAADKHIFSMFNQAGVEIESNLPTADTVMDMFFQARTALMKSGVSDPDDMVYEITPEVSELLLRSAIQLSTDNNDSLKQGCIGRILGSEVFVSNNVQIDVTPSATTHHCFARSKRAIAFAEQVSEIDAYRPEVRFADAVKGLHLYGAKAIYPNELVHMKFLFPGVPED